MNPHINISMTPQERLIDPAELKKLSVLRPYLFVWDLCFDMAVIMGAITLNEVYFFNPLIYLFVVVLIGSRLNALTVLVHETAHFRAFKNKRLNYLFGEPLGWLVLATMEGYRRKHVPHHNKLNTLEDPDWVIKIPQSGFHYPKTRWQFVGDVLRQVGGLGYIDLIPLIAKSKFLRSIPRKIKIMRLCFYITVIAICAATGTLYGLLLYWFIPMVTVFTLLLWLRSLAEHYNLEYDHPYNYARTIKLRWYEAFILSPHNINYHIEHHLYPNVPYYNLGRLHEKLMQHPAYRAKAHITDGVLTGLVRELLGKPYGPSFAQMVAWQKEQMA